MSVAAQRNDWHDPCLRVNPGITNLGEVPPNPKCVDAHIRIRQPRPGALAIATLAWNASDSLNYSYCRLRLFGGDDDIYAGEASLTIGRMRGGKDYPEEEHSFTPSPGFESLCLVYDGYSARAMTKDASCSVAYDPDGAAGIWLVAKTPLDCQRLSAMWLPRPAIEKHELADLAAIEEALAPSTDKAEGLWEYMDRDIDPGAASLGGRYHLATIKNAEGDYDIVYLGGAEAEAGRWTPMSIKGRLSPTIFIGNYDLVWIDADGNRLERECNAQIDINGAILTLRFPLQKAQIRLRRCAFR
ncbi:MAG: hypothetical protein NC102_01970 [Clostridium sp.]|nr:hypothetical protein [Clostridium sp.]